MGKKRKIAVIGAGNMGSAIAASIANAQVGRTQSDIDNTQSDIDNMPQKTDNGRRTTEDYQIVCTAASEKTLNKVRAEIPSAEVTLSNVEAVRDADIVLLCVKPFIAPAVFPEIVPVVKPGATVISVIASLSIDDLSNIFDAKGKNLSIVKVIPNTAIRYGKSATFITFADDVPNEIRGEITDIFNLSGKAFVIKEREMGACTALASCGIAYFLRFIRAAAEGSVELGLKAAFATEVAALTAEGAAALLKDGSHPEVEIDKVTTPGGITIRGLNALEEHGFTAAVIAALKASTIK